MWKCQQLQQLSDRNDWLNPDTLTRGYINTITCHVNRDVPCCWEDGTIRRTAMLSCLRWHSSGKVQLPECILSLPEISTQRNRTRAALKHVYLVIRITMTSSREVFMQQKSRKERDIFIQHKVLFDQRQWEEKRIQLLVIVPYSTSRRQWHYRISKAEVQLVKEVQIK